MKLAVRVLAWAVGLGLLYAVLAPILLVAVLGAMLTAGIVDWAGEGREAPADPVTIGYRGDPMTAFGYPFETVTYPTELGEAEAWVVPAAAPSTLWAIWVHGIGGIRENGYRMLKTLHEAGVPIVMITYRNDRGAPASDDRLYSFGLGEWKDLEAAVDWTQGLGAERVVILAESMGAAITGQYLGNASDTRRVAGLALDAPALDFPAVIHAGGARYGVPLSDVVVTAGLGLWTLFRRDLREAVSIEAVAKFEGPVFLAHGTRDPLVPFSISERLVQRRPDIVFVKSDADRHPMSFEADRAAYAAGLQRWLEAVKAGLRQ